MKPSDSATVAREYRGYLIIVMPSGRTMIHDKDMTDTGMRRFLHEVERGTGAFSVATAWIDQRIFSMIANYTSRKRSVIVTARDPRKIRRDNATR